MNRRVVLDTNILVSALWSRDGNPAKILQMVLERRLMPCYDYRMMYEYRQVLNRPKFQFTPVEVRGLLAMIETGGISIVARVFDGEFADETDRKFFEVAKECDAILITGNIKHFPKEPFVMMPAGFLEML